MGIGVTWNSYLGKVDFNYTSRTYSREGDVGAEFQVLISE